MEGSSTVTRSNFFPSPVNYSSQGVEDTTTVGAVTTSLKNVFATFHCLSWLFQRAFFSASQLVYLLSPSRSNHKGNLFLKEINGLVLSVTDQCLICLAASKGAFLPSGPRFLESRWIYPPISVKSTIKFLIPRINNSGLKRSSWKRNHPAIN